MKQFSDATKSCILIFFKDGSVRGVLRDTMTEEYNVLLEEGDILPPDNYMFTRDGECVPTPEYATSLEEERRKEEREQSRRTGKIYEPWGIVIPFTSKDAAGVMNIHSLFSVGGTSTTMRLSNGVERIVYSNEFPDFIQWFMLERNNYFL